MIDKNKRVWSNPDPNKIAEILRDIKTIAVVGMSAKPERDSHKVGKYLMEKGYEIIPVNPAEQAILGQRSYPDLGSINKAVDLVDIFRKSEATPPIVKEAIAAGTSYIWLQLGIISQESYDLAKEAGKTIVMDKCMLREHRRLGL